MKKDFILPILSLTLICLFITAALAVTNSFTAPVIQKAAAERAETARSAVIPEAAGFELMQVEGLPDTVTEVYKTTNNVGYIFMLTTSGYGGEIKILCGIDRDGIIIATNTLQQTETKGMGSKITEDAFAGQFPGKDSTLSGVDAISGATISSRAYLDAIQDVFAAYDIVKEGR